MAKYQPFSDHCLVLPPQKKTTTDAGIVIPDTVEDMSKPQTGVIKAVGPGRLNEFTGERMPMYAHVDQPVIFGNYAGIPIELSGKQYLIIRQDDLLLGEIEEAVEAEEEPDVEVGPGS